MAQSKISSDLLAELLAILGITVPTPTPIDIITPTLRQRLQAFLDTGATITQVYITPTQIPGEPDLLGVKVIDIGIDFVVFSQSGSGAGSTFTIDIDSILGIEV